jgi:hypothetical protein
VGATIHHLPQSGGIHGGGEKSLRLRCGAGLGERLPGSSFGRTPSVWQTMRWSSAH